MNDHNKPKLTKAQKLEQARNNVVSVFEISKRFLKVDNMNIFSNTKYEFLHFWIPSSCLVSEVNAALQ